MFRANPRQEITNKMSFSTTEGHPVYTKDAILRRQTLLGVMTERARRYPSDSGERWRQINPLWRRSASQLIANVVVCLVVIIIITITININIIVVVVVEIVIIINVNIIVVVIAVRRIFP